MRGIGDDLKPRVDDARHAVQPCLRPRIDVVRPMDHQYGHARIADLEAVVLGAFQLVKRSDQLITARGPRPFAQEPFQRGEFAVGNLRPVEVVDAPQVQIRMLRKMLADIRVAAGPAMRPRIQ